MVCGPGPTSHTFFHKDKNTFRRQFFKAPCWFLVHLAKEMDVGGFLLVSQTLCVTSTPPHLQCPVPRSELPAQSAPGQGFPLLENTSTPAAPSHC